jgi:hypothetical protein
MKRSGLTWRAKLLTKSFGWRSIACVEAALVRKARRALFNVESVIASAKSSGPMPLLSYSSRPSSAARSWAEEVNLPMQLKSSDVVAIGSFGVVAIARWQQLY